MKFCVWVAVYLQLLGGVVMVISGLAGSARRAGNYDASDVLCGCLMLTLVGFCATYLWTH